MLSPVDASFENTEWSDVSLRFTIGDSQGVAFLVSFAGSGAAWSGAPLAGLAFDACGSAPLACNATAVLDGGDTKTRAELREQISEEPFCAALTACDRNEADDAKACANIARSWQGQIVTGGEADSGCPAAPRPVELALAWTTKDAVFTCGIFSRRF